MIKDEERQPLKANTLVELSEIEAHAYCLFQALRSEENLKLACVADSICNNIRSVIDDEIFFRAHVKEEMLKFEQGFAYKAPAPTPPDLEFEED